MTDVFDRAQEREEEMRQDALAEQARRAHLGDRASAKFCERCDEPIPQARRLAVPGVQTCVVCQQVLERSRR
jgi:phage/conjugal plasmid C-4 type zinc finger TraR family protein